MTRLEHLRITVKIFDCEEDTNQCCVELVRVTLRIRRVNAQRDAVCEDRYQNKILKRSGTSSLRQQAKISLDFEVHLLNQEH